MIDEFIPTLEEDDGICSAHPENLPGVKQDGSVCHFFHRTAKAYHTGNRKRRKIQEDRKSQEDRWHKTGKTRPVIENGIHRGWKKILVLYVSTGKGEKFEKTNWVMHQYHLGSEEDENDGEFVVSKIFYQQQHKQSDKNEVPQETEPTRLIPIPDPLTPVTSAPKLSSYVKSQADLDSAREEQLDCMDSPGQGVSQHTNVNLDYSTWQGLNCQENTSLDESTLLPKESQLRVDSQQLLDDFLFCAETVQCSSPRNLIPDPVEHGRIKAKELDNSGNESDAIPCLDNTELDTPQNAILDQHGRINAKELDETVNAPDTIPCLDTIDLDTPPDIENMELHFNSQESLSAWTRG